MPRRHGKVGIIAHFWLFLIKAVKFDRVLSASPYLNTLENWRKLTICVTRFLLENNITAKLNNQFQQVRLLTPSTDNKCSIDSEDDCVQVIIASLTKNSSL